MGESFFPNPLVPSKVAKGKNFNIYNFLNKDGALNGIGIELKADAHGYSIRYSRTF